MRCSECKVMMRWNGVRTVNGLAYDVYQCVNGHEKLVRKGAW